MSAPSREMSGSHASSQGSRCSECKKRFIPSPRLKQRQKTCTEVICQRKHRSRYQRRYRSKNPEVEQESRRKIKEKRSKDFWKNYRKSHVESTERNRALTKLRKQLAAKGLQRQLDIVQVFDPPQYFGLFQEFATSHRCLIKRCRARRAA
jgi:hypothetical protein